MRLEKQSKAGKKGKMKLYRTKTHKRTKRTKRAKRAKRTKRKKRTKRTKRKINRSNKRKNRTRHLRSRSKRLKGGTGPSLDKNTEPWKEATYVVPNLYKELTEEGRTDLVESLPEPEEQASESDWPVGYKRQDHPSEKARHRIQDIIVTLRKQAGDLDTRLKGWLPDIKTGTKVGLLEFEYLSGWVTERRQQLVGLRAKLAEKLGLLANIASGFLYNGGERAERDEEALAALLERATSVEELKKQVKELKKQVDEKQEEVEHISSHRVGEQLAEAAGGSVKPPELDPPLSLFLQKINLQQYEGGMREKGVSSVEDLPGLLSSDLVNMGMKPLEIQRLRRRPGR